MPCAQNKLLDVRHTWAIKSGATNSTLAILEKSERFLYQGNRNECFIVYLLNGLMRHKCITLHITKFYFIN